MFNFGAQQNQQMSDDLSKSVRDCLQFAQVPNEFHAEPIIEEKVIEVFKPIYEKEIVEVPQVLDELIFVLVV